MQAEETNNLVQMKVKKRSGEGRRAFLRGATKLAGVATLFGLAPGALTSVVHADTAAAPAPGPTPVSPDEAARQTARVDLITEFIASGKLDVAVKKFPNAKLSAEQLASLKSITTAELAAIRSLRTKLLAVKLPSPDLMRAWPGFGCCAPATTK